MHVLVRVYWFVVIFGLGKILIHMFYLFLLFMVFVIGVAGCGLFCCCFCLLYGLY